MGLKSKDLLGMKDYETRYIVCQQEDITSSG